MLRKAMKLEDIANLMRYINGDVEDTSDDIIDDILLYDILCRIIFTAEDEGAFDTDHVKKLVADEVAENNKDIADGEKLKKAMYVMVMGYRSGCLRTEMEKGLEVILDEM
jgi:uncharacterized protein (DUF924 family)